MNAVVLTPDNTLEMSRIGHRLALGVQWRDALSSFAVAMPASTDMVTDLEAIGQRPCPLRFDAHGEGRHAIRHSGRFAKLLARAVLKPEPVDDGNPANDADGLLLSLHVFARRHRQVPDYQTGNDPRVFVPRRLAFMPVLIGGVPPATTGNIRQAWLWPGAAYPIASRATVLRGRIRRQVAPGVTVPLPWARVILTRPGAGVPNFAAEIPLGWAHGDDRGEFLLLLGAHAVTGAVALLAEVPVHVWVFTPPVASVFDANQPLGSLPLERAGASTLDDVLKGIAPPPGYVQQAPIDLGIKLGQAQAMSDASLVFT